MHRYVVSIIYVKIQIAWMVHHLQHSKRQKIVLLEKKKVVMKK